MNQSLMIRLIVSIAVIVLTILVSYSFHAEGKLKIQGKIGAGIAIAYFLYGGFHAFSLLYYYDLIVGTTTGLGFAAKQTSSIVEYEYFYRNKYYNGSKHRNGNVITTGGKYYVRVSKLLPFESEMDFSMPVREKNSKPTTTHK